MPELLFSFFAGDHIEISQAFGERLVVSYPELNVIRELMHADAWLEANPRKRPRNKLRFVVNWLNKEARQESRRPSDSHIQVGRGPEQGTAHARIRLTTSSIKD